MDNFWSDFPEIYNDLAEVKKLLVKSVSSNEKIIEESLLNLINSGGKMLRPAFVLLSGRFGNYDGEKLYNLASVIELLHMATLIHDDIIDNSELRRGRKTAYSEYGSDSAVFIGDFLFCRCFMLLSGSTSIENMKSLSKVISRICIGEIHEYSSKRRTDKSVMDYLKSIGGKTAALFALSFFVGAHESGCSEKLTNKLARIGYNIGMAFQIIDDILDCTGTAEVIGKPAAHDIKDGVYTLPVIYALRDGNRRLVEILARDQYSEGDVKNIMEIVEKTGALERARDLAEKYTNKCFKLIGSLPENNYRKMLMEITERLLDRDF